MSAREASYAAYFGRLQEARVTSRRAVAEAQQAGQPERSALWAAGAAVREGLIGNKKDAIDWTNSALKLSNEREVEYGAALAFALAGEPSRAEAIASNLEKQYHEASSVRFNYLPTVRAVLDLGRRDPLHALQALEPAKSHELGIPPSAISGLFGALYPIYFRGLAYLAANKPVEAASEFQQILNHQGIVVSDPVAVLARLQLARAYTQSGNLDKATSEYRDLLATWHNADPDNLLFKQAEMESAKLRR